MDVTHIADVHRDDRLVLALRVRHLLPECQNNYFTEMCSGSEAGSHLRLIEFVYHSVLGLGVIKKKSEMIDSSSRSASVICSRATPVNVYLSEINTHMVCIYLQKRNDSKMNTHTNGRDT